MAGLPAGCLADCAVQLDPHSTLRWGRRARKIERIAPASWPMRACAGPVTGTVSVIASRLTQYDRNGSRLARGTVPLPARLIGLLCLLAVSASSFAGFGDRWTAQEADVPLLSGPDHSYSVLVRLGPTDVVSQESNRVVRGFLKVKLARDPVVVGYVEEASLLLVERFDPQPRTTRKMPANPSPAPPPPTGIDEAHLGAGAWVAIAILVVLGLAGGIAVVLNQSGLVPRPASMPSVRDWVAGVARRIRSGFREIVDSRRSPAGDGQQPPALDARDLVADLNQHIGSPRERGGRLLDAGEVDEALWAKAMTLSVGDVAEARETYLDLWVAKHWGPPRGAVVQPPTSAKPPSSGPPRDSAPFRPTNQQPRRSATPSATRWQQPYLLPLILIGSATLAPLLAGSILLWQVTFFIVPPIGAIPEGATVLAWRSNFGRLLDSPDASCKRKVGAVSPLCRAAAIAAFADAHEIIKRLPYSETLYDLSFRD